MGGDDSERKNTNRMLDARFAQQQAEHDEFQRRNRAQTEESRQRNLKAYDSAFTGFNSLVAGTPEDANVVSARNNLIGGGISDEERGRLRGGGVFDEFSRTGGVSDADKRNLRARATSVIPSLYGGIRDQANRQRIVQGGYGPGNTAMFARLARNQAAGISGAARDAELGILDRVNAGRQWGAGAMSDAEGRIVGQESSNRTAGLGLELDARRFREAMKLAGTSGLASLYGATPGYLAEEGLGLSEMGQNASAASNLLSSRFAANPDTHWYDALGPFASLLGGVGGAVTPFIPRKQ